MRFLLSLVLSQVAAGVVASAVADGVQQTYVQVLLAVPVAVLWLYCALREEGRTTRGTVASQAYSLQRLLTDAVLRVDDGRTYSPSPSPVAPSPDLLAEYHQDCVAWADGEVSLTELLEKWSGRVPDGPRASERRKEDAEIALFKEVLGKEIKAELEREGGKPHWTCKVYLGIHEDGPCKCQEPAPLDWSAFLKPGMEFRPSKFMPGQWVRNKMDGSLIQVEAFIERTSYGERLYSVACGCGVPRMLFERALEPALPREGEWWGWTDCPQHLRVPEGGSTGPQRVPPIGDASRKPELERAAATCNCLRPVNFGKGDGRDL